MLSRVAENVYWMGRYLERVEDTARLVNSMTNLLLDLPRNVELGWYELIKVIGAEENFQQCFPDSRDERSVMMFLINDTRNAHSIASCVNYARENNRVTRDLIPFEVWEQVNELYHFVNKTGERALSRRQRNVYLRQVVLRCQTIMGILMGTITHDASYYFFRMGKNLERADMSSRIIDVAAGNLLGEEENHRSAFNGVRWMGVLRSLNAFQAYRLKGAIGVHSAEVLNFLFSDTQFPRSVGHCLESIRVHLELLPRCDECIASVKELSMQLQQSQGKKMTREIMHQFIDDLQLGLAQIHSCVSERYFRI